MLLRANIFGLRGEELKPYTALVLLGLVLVKSSLQDESFDGRRIDLITADTNPLDFDLLFQGNYNLNGQLLIRKQIFLAAIFEDGMCIMDSI